MYYRRLMLTLTGCLFFCVLYAQREQVQFSRLDISNGMSHNQVNCILKDAGGMMWFGTLSGLNRYNGYEFKTFKHDPGDTTSLSDDFITSIYELPDQRLYIDTRGGPNIYDPRTETFSRNIQPYFKSLHINAKPVNGILKDKRGNFYFNAVSKGIYLYNTHTGTTTLLRSGTGVNGMSASEISSLQSDSKGNIWVIHRDKTIELLDSRSGKVLNRIEVFRQPDVTPMIDYKIFVDSSGAIWVYTINMPAGISYYDPSTGEKRFIDKGKGSLNSNLISSIGQDEKGLIWIATDHGGVNLLNKNDFSIRYLLNKENDLKSIGQNSILSLYRDQSGIMWLGTFKKGISFYHEKILKFPLYRHQGTGAGGLAYEDVNRFAEDADGNLWIGTNGGGLFYFDRRTGKFTRYLHDPQNPNSLSNDIIVSLYIDKKGKLWIGTYFGGLSSFDGKTFRHFKHDPQDNKTLADDRVWDILEDHKGNFWIATLSGGLDRMDRRTGTFTHTKAGGRNSIGSDFISCLIEDRAGNIWIGTSDGIDMLNQTGRFVHYKNKAGQANSLSNNIVYDLMQDSYGFIWAATRDGISRLDPRSGKFRNFDSKDGLTEKATLKILEDANRNLWLSTANGLFNILVSRKGKNGFSYAFRKYDAHDGLQGNAFNANAAYKTRGAELLFGGANGFNLFRPENIKDDYSVPKIILSDLQLSNSPVTIGEKINGHVVLKQSIAVTQELKLRYNENGFTIGFAALNYFNPQKIRYRYMLEGFDHNWQELQNDSRRAIYTNIDPGSYVFRVMSTDASGNWVNNETKLAITIMPPFWRTTLAYILYIIFAGGTLLLLRHRGISKIRREFLVEQERQQAKRLHELDMLKIRFLTNVSHEFRTPLSLIITPLEKLIRQAKVEEKQQLQMIQRNGRRLLNLVNQLLDFRKMEEEELKLHPSPGDIIQFIRDLSNSFSDIAEHKHIILRFTSERSSLLTHFDHDKIERIVFNLLSNAFKFTPQYGEINITLKVSTMENGQVSLLMEISDTGIGIPQDKQDKIFDRFFQHDVPDSMVNQGSGIGLAITREFVRLHGGEISVESDGSCGSTFIVTLFFAEQQEQQMRPEKSLQVEISAGKKVNTGKTELILRNKKPIIMLVEDNEDFRFYLKDNLKEHYQIAEASNGREGWQKILSLHPDLVVSDVSMPEMNGIELCKKIKDDKRTAHLPVILLTALTTEYQQLTGLETGASDYITKPFNFEILLSRIRNLLQQQALSKKTYQKQLEIKPADTEIESVDHKFIRQISLHIEQHLADASYTVDQLSADMNMSRVGLYKKILPLTGKTPIEYIRLYRLRKAQPLLLKSQMTIAEIAYEVGFSNPKHFSRYFKEEFGILPSAYVATKTAQLGD